MKIIDRYVLREITFPFLASLFSITFVLLLGKILQLMDLMVNKGVSFFDIMKLLFFLMPYLLLFTVPISFLISILVGLGRLASDNEITVLKGAGISLSRLYYPVALASVAAFLITLSLSFAFVPYGRQATKNLLYAVIRQNASAGIKEKVFNDRFQGLLIYVNHIPAHGGFMEGVIISDRRLGKEPSTIFAEKAFLFSDAESRRVGLRLERGSTHSLDFKLKNYRKMDFTSYDLNLEMEAAVAETAKTREKDGKEMSAGELMGHIRSSGTDAAIRREMAVELNKRITFPLTCLVFGLLGMPIGVNIRKSAKARGLTTGIFIVLLYYLLQLGGTALAETGRISPLPGLWFPIALFTIGGLLLFAAAAKERSPGMESIRRFLFKHGKMTIKG